MIFLSFWHSRHLRIKYYILYVPFSEKLCLPILSISNSLPTIDLQYTPYPHIIKERIRNVVEFVDSACFTFHVLGRIKMSYRSDEPPRMNRSNSNECRLYVGNLPDDIRVRDLEDVFYKYGSVKDVELKLPKGRGSPYAFVEFDDPR